jgi:hypothetical protein
MVIRGGNVNDENGVELRGFLAGSDEYRESLQPQDNPIVPSRLAPKVFALVRFV